jgi:hypothetical protein
MNKLLFMPLLLVLLPMAYAEESTVSVPFDFVGQSCTFDEIAIEYHCVWQGTPDKMTLEDLEGFKDVLTDEEYLEAFDSIVEDQVREAESVKEEKKTPAEIKLDNLIADCRDSNGCSYADKEYIDALRTLFDSCELGIDAGARIQSYEFLQLPEDRPDTLFKSINLANYQGLRQILLDIEACDGWNVFKPQIEQYNNIHLDYRQGEADYHANHAMSGYTYDPYFTAPLDFKGEETKSWITGCEHNYWAQNLKRQNGCDMGEEFEHDSSLQQPMKDYMNNSIMKGYVKFQNGETSEQLYKNIRETREAKPTNYGGSQ